MYINNKLLIAKNSDKELSILPKMINRHGIITGATGTGKTTTVKIMIESFSSAGIPVLIADVKGDLSSIGDIGIQNESVENRLNKLNIANFNYSKFPTRFWDIYGNTGHKVRACIDSFNASLLSRILELSESQEGNLNIALKIAKDMDIRITDFDDLKQLLNYILDNKNDLIKEYGNITTQSITTIQRKLLSFENTGGDIFFGEPELEIDSLKKYDSNNGFGFVNILDATELIKDYNLYSTYMLWILNKLYDELPEVGDLDKPKLVFFIDEAHLLFDEIKPSFLRKITQIVKLIRSKGVGLYFISQSPSDIPEDILSQLGNRVQHNLKAYTPQEMKNIKAAANGFRANDKFDTEEAITELETGEALISFINENGQPEIVERAYILPPQSKMGTIEDSLRQQIINESILKDKYDIKLEKNENCASIKLKKEDNKVEEKDNTIIKKDNKKPKSNKKSKTEKAVDKVINQAANTIGRKIGNQIWKNLFK